jgi:hypothetical protein
MSQPAADRTAPHARPDPGPGPAGGRVRRLERSALLHPGAADALILAASPYPGRTSRRRRIPRPGLLRRLFLG